MGEVQPMDMLSPPEGRYGGDIEATLARHTARRAFVVGPPLVALFWLLSGPVGAWSAAVGVAIVAANFLISGWALSRAAQISLTFYHAAALIGFIVRLLLIAGAMLAVAGVFEPDRLAMGMAAIVSYLALLTWESVAVAKGRERELEWTQ